MPPPPGAGRGGDHGAGTSPAASIADSPPSAAPPASSADGGDHGAGASPASNSANPAGGAEAGVASFPAISAPTPPCVGGGGSRYMTFSRRNSYISSFFVSFEALQAKSGWAGSSGAFGPVREVSSRPRE